MGNCFSDPSKPKQSGGQRLGSGTPTPTGGAAAGGNVVGKPSGSVGGKSKATPASRPPQALGGSPGSPSSGSDPRSAALAAAEARAQAEGKKGVSTSNPKSGQLSAKLAAERRASSSQQQQGNERMMDAGQWN